MAEEDPACSSKNENPKNTGEDGDEVKNDERRMKYDDKKDVSNSDFSSSASYYSRSRRDRETVYPNREGQKSPVNGSDHRGRQGRDRMRKKSKRRAGRVTKPRRRAGRRQNTRRAPKRRSLKEKRTRDISPFTNVTGLSSRSRNFGCKYCGHCVCRRE